MDDNFKVKLNELCQQYKIARYLFVNPNGTILDVGVSPVEKIGLGRIIQVVAESSVFKPTPKKEG